jgi:catechol 2,3-dioxygenase-like lactoylglutathione lyase family enzyme
MSRVQLALNVDDLDAAVAFYSRLFGTGPAKLRAGYANFAIDVPPLKLVLFEQPGKGGTINHLGVEVEDAAGVQAAGTTLRERGLDTDVEENVTCCYAVQTREWAADPDGNKWEVYVVLDNDGAHHHSSAEARPAAQGTGAACCAPGCCAPATVQ